MSRSLKIGKRQNRYKDPEIILNTGKKVQEDDQLSKLITSSLLI